MSGGVQDDPRGTLAHALDYRRDAIIHKFLERFDVSFEEAEAVFEETKKWLWLTSLEDRPQLVVTQELVLLDEMWHTFVLFTQEYAEYCHSRFGRFIHHAPTTKAEKDERERQRREEPAVFRDRVEGVLRAQLEFIGDRLGPETLFSWFVEYPRRYGPAFFARAARAPMPAIDAALIMQLDDVAARYDDAGAAGSQGSQGIASGSDA